MLKDLAQDFIMKQVSKQIAKATGIDENIINKVTDEWIGSMILGLAKNAGTPEWASSLFSAVQKDHDWSVLDNIGDLFGESKQNEGMKIVSHIFGNKQEAIAGQIGKDTGLDMGSVMKILSTAAPVVLWMLGKQTKDNGFGLDDVVGLLSNEREEVAKKSSGLGIFWKLLDQDGDGDFDLIDAFKMAT